MCIFEEFSSAFVHDEPLSKALILLSYVQHSGDAYAARLYNPDYKVDVDILTWSMSTFSPVSVVKVAQLLIKNKRLLPFMSLVIS